MVWGWLKRRIGGTPRAVLPAEQAGADVLEYLGANPVAVSWARTRSLGLEELWKTCPRVDWLLHLAARAGVPMPSLIRAASELQLDLSPAEWTSADELIGAVGAAVDAAIDGNAEVIEHRENEPSRGEDAWFRWKTDGVEQRVRQRHADHVRKIIPYRTIRTLLYPPARNGPYR